MSPNRETRRTGMCERASEMSPSRGIKEDITSTPIFNQIAWLQARYPLGDAHARLLAELVFARRPQR